ncbi:MAG: efflux RND transporter permease subunit [Streptosporangiaceae bacterium]|nr:efflux RND transporter permease subunit [Streptosporangiaceae bacterium]MBV9857355.1 efflux RND transporter permease subunit [Streptosporangiaceae bacterium]
MRWIVATSLRFRYVVAGFAIALLYFGTLLIGHQKIDVFPEFAPVSVEVQTACLGLSPSEVESLTTVPLEAALHGVPGVYDIRSSSEPELSAIFLYFRGGTDVLRARQLVQERLQATAPTLPTWCDPPQMYPIVSATSRVMQIGLTSATVSAEDLSMIAQWTIRPRLMQVPGVANVAIWGQRAKQIMVEGDPALMAAHGISLDQLMTTAADAVDTGELKYTTGAAVGSLGTVETAQQRLYVHSVQPIATPQQMAQVPLAVVGNRILRIGQVAQVTWGYPPLIGDAVIDGGPGLMLVVEKFPGANTLQVTAGIDHALAALEPGLPGIHVDSQIFRQASFISTAIHNLSQSVILGSILVVFVLIAFLFQWRAAVVSLLAIPLSLAAAGIVFDATGATINTMILAGFAVAVGVVVDDAIIDMENIVRRLRAWRAQGRRTTPLRLVLAASLEVRVAIFYATLINIVAVVPVMLVGGLTGAFFEPLAIAYGLAVLASMAVALTVTPALGLILLQRARLAPRDPPLIRALKRGYAALLKPVLSAPRWAFAAAGVAIIAGVVVYPRLGQDLFPTFKEPDFLVHFVSKPGTSVQEEDREVAGLQDQVLAIPGVNRAGSHIGQALLGEEVSGVNFSETWLSLKPGAGYGQVLNGLRGIAGSYPGAYSDVQTYLHERIDEVLTNGTTEDVAVYIYGDDLGVLQRLGGQVASALSHVPGLTDVQPAPLESIPEADVQVNIRAAQRYGLTPGDVRRAAAIMMASEPMSEISAGGKLYTVAAWSTPATRQNLTDLRDLPVDTPSGGHVPLGAVASIQIAPSPSQIIRENGSRMTEVDANVSGRSLGSVAADVQNLLDRLELPPGYHAQLQGEAVERADAQRRLTVYGIAALLVILLLLQTAFASWRLAVMLLVTLPMALVGGVIAAWAGLGTITLGALVGFFTVLGIAARNGILMISHFRHLERNEGVPFGPALVLRGAGERLSPIMMTALATALALAPLVIYGNQPGQEIEYPMAVVILGGLATSTLLNLFVLPALYLRLGRGRVRQPSIPAPREG